MKLTKRWLKNHSACKDGYDWYISLKTDDLAKVWKAGLKEEKYDDLNWLIVRKLTKSNRVWYAIYAAEQVIDIFEKKHPDDKRPRMAIDAAKAYLKSSTKKAADAADSAADSAADAADAIMQQKILSYGYRLLKKQGRK